LKLYQLKELFWQDVTDANYPETDANMICGTVNSFGPFAILYSTKPVLQTISAPLDSRQVNTTIDATASFTNPDLNDTYTANWDWGDGSTPAGTVNENNNVVSGSHIYTSAGV
jgi:hypothetical protein